MSSQDFLIVGLGNPGRQYETTRHNVGFMVVDELAGRWGQPVVTAKWDAVSCKLSRWGSRLTMIKPQTFMNRSGRAVVEAVNFFKIPLENILVIHDDLDMHPGRLKLVLGGGAGGHNGIRSLCGALPSSSFYRLKIGIGRPGQGGVHGDFPVDRYVLSGMSDDELSLLEKRYDIIEEGVRRFIVDGPAKAMNLINSVK